MKNIKFEMPEWTYLPGILILAGGLKAWLTFSGIVPFNADEAIVALMARHILQGEAPIFFYGQAYMGSLDAWLVAAGFALADEQVWVIRLIQGLLYLGVILTTVLLGNAAFKDRRIGWLAGLLVAIPTVNVSLYTTVSWGGYVETLLIGNLMLLAGLRLANRLTNTLIIPGWQWFLFGFLCGLGFWIFGLSLVYSLPMGLILAWLLIRNRQGGGIWLPGLYVLVGASIGATPWWIYAFQNGFASLTAELFGSAISGVERLGWWGQIWQHLVSLVLLGIPVILGLRPPWEVRWLGLPLIPFVLIFYAATLGFSYKKLMQRDEKTISRLIFHGPAWCLLLGFIFTPYGADPSGRYFLPLSIPLALFAAELIADMFRRSWMTAWSLAALILVFNLWGTIQSALRYPPGLTTQFNPVTQIDNRHYAELIAFLNENNEQFGYTNFWVSYPLAFLSQEEIIFTPRLPYHLDFRYTPRDIRYPRYAQEVARADRVAYITTNHAPLDSYLREQFNDQGITWEEKTIGDFHIFYDLSAVIIPGQIGLGEQRP